MEIPHKEILKQAFTATLTPQLLVNLSIYYEGKSFHRRVNRRNNAKWWGRAFIKLSKNKCMSKSVATDRLVGLSTSRAEDPRFESRLRRDFSGVESYQRL